MIRQYRKKPVLVVAEQFLPDNSAAPWPEEVVLDKSSSTGYRMENRACSFEVGPGDWIVTGPLGVKHPCTPEVFQAIYDKVDTKDTKRRTQNERA